MTPHSQVREHDKMLGVGWSEEEEGTALGSDVTRGVRVHGHDTRAPRDEGHGTPG